MRSILAVLFCWFALFSGTVAAQSETSPSPLQLTTTVISERYCQSDDDLDALALNLSCLIKNIGHEPVIVSKGDYLPNEIKVAEYHRGSNEKKYESVMQPHYVFTSMETPEITPDQLAEDFVILAPGDGFAFIENVTIFVCRDNYKGIDGIPSGDHLLEVSFSTIDITKANAKRLTKAWRKQGRLWTGELTSEPMLFEVSKQRETVDCHSLNQQ